MLKAGDVVERYVIESPLGEGGMGVVYRAHDPRLDRTVALKVVHLGDDRSDASRAEATARLLREARAAAKIDHPNAIGIYDVGEANGDAFIAMELVDGKTLRALLAERALSPEERLRVLADVARALAAAHEKGIVHRDVKPENIMVRRDGGVKVLDFGIARRAARELDPRGPTESDALLTLTAKGVSVGTPLYMTPEQIRGDPLDGRSDQFAWGVVAWEAFAGGVPWSKKGDPMALAGSILLQPVGSLRELAPEVPPELEAVIARALAKAPGDRYASMDELLAALKGCSFAGAAAAAQPAPAPTRAASTPPAPRYSTEMGRAILSRALERQAEAQSSGGYDADDILAAAREVGVDDATLEEAAREVATARAADAASASRRASRGREVRRFLQHVIAYAAVSTFMLVTMGWWMAKWVIFGWGIGIASHTARVILGDRRSDGGRDRGRTERRQQRRERRERKRDARRGQGRARPEERDATIERAADELLSTAARRVRVATSGAVGARVATTGSGGRAAAEAESEPDDGEAPRDEVRRAARRR